MSCFLLLHKLIYQNVPVLKISLYSILLQLNLFFRIRIIKEIKDKCDIYMWHDKKRKKRKVHVEKPNKDFNTLTTLFIRNLCWCSGKKLVCTTSCVISFLYDFIHKSA